LIFNYTPKPWGAPRPATTAVQSGNTITFTFNLLGNTINPTGFTFTGLRVNASAAPANSQITVAASGAAGQGFSTTGTVSTTAAFVYATQLPPTLVGNANVSLCPGGVAYTTTPQNVALLTIQENFGGSFKAPAAFTATFAPGPPAPGTPVAATQGTRFAITFNNLNTGVNYFVPATIGSGGANGIVLTAYPGATGSTASTAVTAGTGAGALANQTALTVVNGSATIYYGVTQVQNLNVTTAGLAAPIQLVEIVPSASAVVSPLTASVTASSVLVGVATGYPQYVPVTTPTPTPTTLSLLTSCSTTLLFPYLTNQAGFDTGIAIANASTGLGGAATSGSCNVTFYGANAPTAAYNTGIITSGTIGTIVLSAVAPNFSGYAVASCNFVQAHADAFIGQFGAGGTLSANYLAVVTTQAGGTGITSPVAF
jgi:hypothetical protein